MSAIFEVLQRYDPEINIQKCHSYYLHKWKDYHHQYAKRSLTRYSKSTKTFLRKSTRHIQMTELVKSKNKISSEQLISLPFGFFLQQWWKSSKTNNIIQWWQQVIKLESKFGDDTSHVVQLLPTVASQNGKWWTRENQHLPQSKGYHGGWCHKRSFELDCTRFESIWIISCGIQNQHTKPV